MKIEIELEQLKTLSEEYQKLDVSIEKKIGYTDCVLDILKLNKIIEK